MTSCSASARSSLVAAETVHSLQQFRERAYAFALFREHPGVLWRAGPTKVECFRKTATGFRTEVEFSVGKSVPKVECIKEQLGELCEEGVFEMTAG